MSEEARNEVDFSAAGSLCGYLYQCRYALLHALRCLKKRHGFSASIETLDDVFFQTEGQPAQLLQTKHHLNQSANLTDASPDLWKTIRIWCERFTSGEIPPGSTFYLVTTAMAPVGSAAAYLKEADEYRNVGKALQRLDATATSSTSQTNRAGYSVYRSLNGKQKTALFSSVYVMDAEPPIMQLDEKLREEVYIAVQSRFLEQFLGRLEGWWLRRAIVHLASESAKAILSEEIDAEMDSLREQFKRENLPIDDDILNATINASVYDDQVFVHQLKLIEIGNNRIFFAIRDYFRAFTQRSRWLREDLLHVGELGRYERGLIEEWELLYEQMSDELGEGAAEEQKKQAAQTLYKWVEKGSLRPIRPNCTESFVSRGSYHMLADSLKVGWHPEFVERLQQLLEPQEVI